MNPGPRSVTSFPTTDSLPGPPGSAEQFPEIRPGKWGAILLAPVKFLWGMLFCQSFPGSLLVSGWTFRLMQRAALKQWWKAAPPARTADGFQSFVQARARTREHVHWPNWFARQDFRGCLRRPANIGRARHLGRVLRASLASLGANLRLGIQATLNTWVFTLPGSMLIVFAWFAGWNNSFNKGYEQAFVGPATGIAGILLIIAAMFYVPMAQARQAVSGQWRAFYQFRMVWSLVRRRWLACTALAGLYALFSIPVMVLTVLPKYFADINPELVNATADQVVSILGAYFFWSAAFLLPAWVILRWFASRIYSSAVLGSVQRGALHEEQLSEFEWETLHRLDLLHVRPAPARHALVRFSAWAATRTGRIVAGCLTALLWFLFVAQMFITQFLDYHGAILWLNHPLVQLPWFHHLPDAIQNPWQQVAAGAALIAVLCLLLSGWRALRPAN
jgi:hypothetical protein